MGQIRQRPEIPATAKWRLSDIYPSNEAWEADFALAQEDIQSMGALQSSLADTKESILGALDRLSLAQRRLEALYCYARMRRDEDSRETEAQARADRIATLSVRAEAAASFLRPALLAMPEPLLADCAADPAFAKHSRTLSLMLRDRPHTLPEAQEALLAEAGEIGDAPQTIYTLFIEADLSFPEIRDERGEMIPVSEARFHSLLLNRDARVREDAYRAILGTYAGFGNTLASIYAASVKNDWFRARTRAFSSAREASLFASEIPETVYDALLVAVEEKLPALNRYLQLKKRALGLPALHMWDLYQDTAEDFELKLSYDDGYRLVLEALAPLGEAYTLVVLQARDAGWIDVYENAGKAHGAYSWGNYDAHPFILMNYEDTLDSASTLAHEMGHAMHSYLSCAAQPFEMYDYTLFAAEVASTVNEILLSCHLLAKYQEPSARQSIIGSLLEHFRTTVFRQTLFAAFEKETHAMQERGEPLTREALCALYLSLNRKYYGEACEVDEIVQNEWMRIPHFYRAFYVYQYATGFSAAACIARKILREGAPAVEGYMKFLGAGGSMPPLAALRLAGVDMETKAPVAEALQWFEELTEAFAGLTL